MLIYEDFGFVGGEAGLADQSDCEWRKALYSALSDASSMATSPKVAPRRNQDASDLELFRLLNPEPPRLMTDCAFFALDF